MLLPSTCILQTRRASVCAQLNLLQLAIQNKVHVVAVVVLDGYDDAHDDDYDANY